MTRDIFRGRPALRGQARRILERLLEAIDGDQREDDPPRASEPWPPTAAPVTASEQFTDSAAFARSSSLRWLSHEEFISTERLYGRLSESDLAEIEQLISSDPDLAARYAAAPDRLATQQLTIAYAIWLGHASTERKTGLRAVQPPEDVHVMARGPLAAAGGLYEADMIIDVLHSAGVEMHDVARALDFGSSSGRVLRVLQAAYPETSWTGCDPNEPAIAWAAENLPESRFFVNDNAPPLALEDASLDLVYAISIWSHFEPGLAIRWFEEMHRVIRPGGHLLCTTHGLTSVAHYALGDMRTPEQSREIADALYHQGWWYAPEFGEEGDWGVVNPDWGTAFLSPEWMLTQLCPRWQVLEFAPGRNQENQDVYVLRRV